ncbi:DUF4352 domain-containing protein [Oscillibacter sp.]|uniref:DUF4352 domain-containing protein n=1 Tax=Oscillibacter sp. TaxID=1945593 RepID=UPI002896C0DF|nr:DUF4352 domain-containing protein [Oscillibacter sp.]
MKLRNKKWISVAALAMMLMLTACGGSSSEEYEEGRIGDVMHSEFFDFTVNSVYICDTYEEYTPDADHKLLVSELTIKNTFNETIPMFDTDFQAQWADKDDQDNAFANPVETMVSEEQMESEYDLAVDEERTGLLIFEVPTDFDDFSIVYLEEFDTGETGNLYEVFFTAKEAGVSV